MNALERLAGIAATVALALLCGAAPAGAVALPVVAELVLQVGPRPDINIAFTASGTAIANGAGPGGALTSLSLPAGLLSPAGIRVDVTDPAAAPIEGLQATYRNDAGVFGTAGGTLGGAMGLPGALRLCLFDNCPIAIANLVIPLTPIGAGGTATQPGNVNLTVFGAPWTTGTAMATGLSGVRTETGYRHGPASAPSSTARAGGSLQLVAPFTFTTSISADGPTTGFAFLTLRFVPEPASIALLGAGIALLAAVGRRRS